MSALRLLGAILVIGSSLFLAGLAYFVLESEQRLAWEEAAEKAQTLALEETKPALPGFVAPAQGTVQGLDVVRGHFEDEQNEYVIVLSMHGMGIVPVPLGESK